MIFKAIDSTGFFVTFHGKALVILGGEITDFPRKPGLVRVKYWPEKRLILLPLWKKRPKFLKNSRIRIVFLA
jgi:hypothetical protein